MVGERLFRDDHHDALGRPGRAAVRDQLRLAIELNGGKHGRDGHEQGRGHQKGNVMCRNRPHAPAPSSSAAS